MSAFRNRNKTDEDVDGVELQTYSHANTRTDARGSTSSNDCEEAQQLNEEFVKVTDVPDLPVPTDEQTEPNPDLVGLERTSKDQEINVIPIALLEHLYSIKTRVMPEQLAMSQGSIFGEKTDDSLTSYEIARSFYRRAGLAIDESKLDQGSVIFEYGKSLLHSFHERVNFKNFFTEVHAETDVENFLQNSYILLDLDESIPEAIMDRLLKKMLPDFEAYDREQIRALLFTEDQLHLASRSIQGVKTYADTVDYDHSWICVMCIAPISEEGRVGIAKLAVPANFGRNCQDCTFVCLILTPPKMQGTLSEVEKARTFATIFADSTFRNNLRNSHTEERFKSVFVARVKELVSRHRAQSRRGTVDSQANRAILQRRQWCGFMTGIIGDLKRRLPHYIDDYVDGVRDKKSVGKSLSCTMFLYFACIMPSIAFGVLNEANTKGILNVKKVLFSQTFGGLVFGLIGGTPQIVLLTTAPLAIFTHTVYTISKEYDINFPAMYACVGLWNAFFLILYASLNLSIVMEFSTRSSEEIFALFTSIAFAYDAFKDTAANFAKYYFAEQCQEDYNRTAALEALTGTHSLPLNKETLHKNLTDALDNLPHCEREISVVYLLLLLGTTWVGVVLYNFTKTPFLTVGKREMLTDYALPISVITMTIIGVFFFQDVDMGKSFDDVTTAESVVEMVDFSTMSLHSIFGAMGLGFCLSLLFFMDQNITAAFVNSPQNKMKKGTAYHWDLLVIAVVNVFTSIYAFPMVHAALPHSPLHVQALADVEERVFNGHVIPTVVKVRETRVCTLLSHVMIGASIYLMFVLAYIPTPVLYGLFLYVAITGLNRNQLVERITLFFTEQSAYPPSHYVRHVPQRKLHLFTLLQVVQVLFLCVMGFIDFPFIKMFFPVIIFILIPIRHKVVTKIIEQKYLDALDHV